MWSIQQSVQNGQFLGRLLRMRWRSYCAPPAGGIIAAMANAFGLVLDSASVRRAAVEGVPETVIGTIYLLHENSVDDIASKLTPHELGHVIRLVGRCPGCYPPGTLAALKSRSLTHSHEPPSVACRPIKRLVSGPRTCPLPARGTALHLPRALPGPTPNPPARAHCACGDLSALGLSALTDENGRK